MIEPTEADIGRRVVYTRNARHPGGELQRGVITSFNPHLVFVRYGAGTTSAGTWREDLEWDDAETGSISGHHGAGSAENG
jgi:hypothetical protein